MKIYLAVGVDGCCSVEIKAFKTEEEAEKCVEKMDRSTPSWTLCWYVKEIDVED